MTNTSILYFAWLREHLGFASENVEIPSTVKTLDHLITYLEQCSDAHAKVFADRTQLRCAQNQEFAELDEPFIPGAEIAFFPPVTGG